MIDEKKLIEELNQWARDNFSLDNKFEYMLAGMEKALDIIESQPPADQWIPCSERLPELYQPVLVTAIKWQTALLKKPEYYVDAGYCDSEGAFWLSRARTRQFAEAWMPLPEPYKGVE